MLIVDFLKYSTTHQKYFHQCNEMPPRGSLNIKFTRVYVLPRDLLYIAASKNSLCATYNFFIQGYPACINVAIYIL